MAFVLGAVLAFDGARSLLAGRHPGALWLDLRWTSAAAATTFLLLAGGAVMVGALATSIRAKRGGAIVAALVGAHAARDAMGCVPRAGLLSFSAALALLSVVFVITLLHDKRPEGPVRYRYVFLVAGAALALVALPAAQMAGSAHARYERPADAVVVLGARVYANGSPSLALADRVHTACDLMNRGLAPKLILSGGPGDGAFHETDTMRRMAIECGVPEDAIEIDRDGLSTRHTAQHVASLFARGSVDHGRPKPRALVVSHDYHLARVRFAFDASGVSALTVPAAETRPLIGWPYFAAREIPGFWAYWGTM
ncbi:MAG: YdcF family protein [Polyangiaceae bacterium]|nr:YdcF family protein [Polyangiaceae bacterium]